MLGDQEVKDLLHSVSRASKYIPEATCLTQALAAQYLCARAGRATSIRIGVAKRDDGTIGAHAWLIDGDQILIGGSEEELGDFTHLVDLGSS